MEKLTPADSRHQLELEDLKKLRDMKLAMQREARRVGYNQGIADAAKTAQASWVKGGLAPSETARIAEEILRLKKPKTSPKKFRA